MFLPISKDKAEDAATAASPLFKILPPELRSRIYAYYFESYIVSFTNDEQDILKGILMFMRDQPGAPRPSGLIVFDNKVRLPSFYEGQNFMAYGEGSIWYTGDTLEQQQLRPLLCVSRQVYLEAAPLVVKHAHFSFSRPEILQHAFDQREDTTQQSLSKVSKLMREGKHFCNVTSLQVRFSGPGRRFTCNSAQSLANNLTKNCPKLQQLVVDVSLNDVIDCPAYLPKPWLAEMLWHLRLKQLSIIDSVAATLESGDHEVRTVSYPYIAALKKHCQEYAQTYDSGSANTGTDRMETGNARLRRGDNDGSVLRCSIFGLVWQHVVNTPGQYLLVDRLSKVQNWYCARSGLLMDAFDV